MEIYRKRFQPDECIHLKDDEIVYSDKSYICTKWETLRPKEGFDNGASIYDIDHGVKVSKFCLGAEVQYYYIDIIDMQYDEKTDTYTCVDYVFDIILQPNLHDFEVVDGDEFEELIEKGTFTSKEVAETYAKLLFMTTCIEESNFHFYLEIFKNVGI